MRRPTIPLILGFLLLMIAFVYLAQAAFIVQLIGVVDRVEGAAEVQRQGKGRWFTLRAESFVRTGDVVRTDEDSRAEIRWLDGTRMRIAPKSRLKITKSTMNTLRKSKDSEFRLDLGKIWIRIIDALTPESKFEIATPTATAAVRGTIFSVEVQPNGGTEVSVYDGKVAIATGRQEMSVAKGLNALVDAAGVPPRPENQSPTDETQWQEQTGIITPALNVRRPAGDETVTAPRMTISGTVEPTATLTLNGVPIERKRLHKDKFEYTLNLKPGENVLRVIATDRKGITTEVTRRITLQ